MTETPSLYQVEELKEKVLSEIEKLPQIHREIIILRHLFNIPYKEMARTLGVPRATIESRLYRARQMLRESIILTDLIEA